MEHRFISPIPKNRESSYGTAYFKSYSRKLGRCITAFSSIGYDNLIVNEMDCRVLWYCERPLSQNLTFSGREHKIQPDVYVEYADGTGEFQWVRHDITGDLGEIINSWSKQTGERIRILSEEDISPGTFFLRNLRYIYAKAIRYDSFTSKVADKAFIEYLKTFGKKTVAQLITEGQISEHDGLAFLSDLFYRGLINFVDFTCKPFSYKMEVIASEK